MLKRNSIKFHSTHTDSSHYINENRLAVWVILEIFWTVSLIVLNIDWVQFVLKNCEIVDDKFIVWFKL